MGGSAKRKGGEVEMKWQPSKEEHKHLKLVLSMTTDCMMGKGTDTVKTYAMNLRNIAEGIEVIANKPTGQRPEKVPGS